MNKNFWKSKLMFLSLFFPLGIAISCGGNQQNEKGSLNKVFPRKKSIEYEFKNNSSLKYNDSWWSLDNLSYSKDAHLNKGKGFYSNLELTNGKYPQFNIEDWINVYDTNSENILKDKKHIYKNSSPNSYFAKNQGFIPIYHHDKNLGKTKTGNNNNGLNGLYSGANFIIDSINRNRTYDISVVETIDNLYFTPDKQISNGWEHVSPQSQNENVWGEKSEITKKANGDLHNIRPSIQNLFNGPRGNNPFGIVPGDTNKYGVDFEIGESNFGNIVVEPRVNVRGDIARIIFYMHDRYHITYDLDYYKQLALWAAMDPVTKEERDLDSKISEVMGFRNGYVTGKKIIPYYEKINLKVDSANNDNRKNEKMWGNAPQKIIQNDVSTLSKAEALNWNEGKNILYGIRPSKTAGLKEQTNQRILRVVMFDDTIKYLKVFETQSKAIVAKEFGSDIFIKIATNDTSLQNSQRLKTNLRGGKSPSYASMNDFIKEIKYLIID